MTDSEILEKLIEKCGGIKSLASDISVSRQAIWDWRKSGLTLKARIRLRQCAKRYGVRLPQEFIDRAQIPLPQRTAPHGRQT